MMSRSLRLGLAVLAMLAVAADAAAVRERTIQSTRHPIAAIGLENGKLYWSWDYCGETFTRPLAGGSPVRLGDSSRQECGHPELSRWAFGRGRALWTAVGVGNSVYEDVLVGAQGERPKLLEEVVGSSAGGDGDYLSAIAAGGSTIAYSVVSVVRSDTCVDPGTPCDHVIRSRRTMRVVGRRAVRVPGAVPPAVALAAGGGRIAVDVARGHDGEDLVRAGRIEIRDAASGRLAVTIKTTGNVLELGLSRNVLALLVRHGGRKLIERYAPTSGRLLGRTPIYGNARGLAVSGKRVIFITGRAIRQVGRGIVVVAATRPVAVAVDGQNLVWAERAGTKGRILAA